MGLLKFKENVKTLKKKYNLDSEELLFNFLHEKLKYYEPLAIALTALENNELEGYSWKWMHDNLGQGEVSKVKIGSYKISRNIRDTDTLEFLRFICDFWKLSCN